jgi:FtsZ-interacting cell division protein ZipA
MDASTFRWVLIVIAVLLAIGIYLFGQHQARLRKRSAIETFTREEIDSAFIEDEQLRFELNNLNQILRENEIDENLDDIQINPARDMQKTPFALPDPEIYVPDALAARDQDHLISYHLRHEDFRLITGEEAETAVQQVGLETGSDGFLQFHEEDMISFQIASLSKPGHFFDIGQLEFTTLGLNCYIDLDSCEHPRLAYESMLKKIDELVRALNVKVYKSNQELLTISDVTSTRETLT